MELRSGGAVVRKLELVVEDDQSKAAAAIVIHEKLIIGRRSTWCWVPARVRSGWLMTARATPARGSRAAPTASPSVVASRTAASPVRGGPLELRVPLQKPGYFQYVCTIHASMEGDLYVEE